MIPGFQVSGIEGTRVPCNKNLESMFTKVVTWRRITEGMVCARPHRNSWILLLEEKTKKKENLSCRSGCVTNFNLPMNRVKFIELIIESSSREFSPFPPEKPTSVALSDQSTFHVDCFLIFPRQVFFKCPTSLHIKQWNEIP